MSKTHSRILYLLDYEIRADDEDGLSFDVSVVIVTIS